MGQAGLTAVFGMGTGVTPPVWSPRIEAKRMFQRFASERWLESKGVAKRFFKTWNKQSEYRGRGVESRSTRIRLHGSFWKINRPDLILSALFRRGLFHRFPVLADEREFAAAGRGGQVSRLLGPVRCGGRPPYTSGPSTWSSSRSLRSFRYRKPGLGGGFALRCLQRLSCPDLATRRCPERDSRHTRGRSSPILSY